MSFNGSGVFSINTTGQPVVAGTTISASVFNAFTADIATGLSTCMLKDGTQTATAGIGFFAGTVSLPGIYFGTDTATGLYRIGLNNTGYSINGTKLLDLSSALLGITGSLTVSSTTTLSGALTYGGVTLSNSVTGTGSMVLSASPTFTGTVSAAAATLSSTLTLSGTAANIALGSNYISNGGTDAGLSFDGSNKATFSGAMDIGGNTAITGTLSAVVSGGTANPGNAFWFSDNSSSAMMYARQNGAGDLLALSAGATERFRVQNDGDTEIGGNLTVSGTGTSSFAGPVKTGGYTVATLPANAAGLIAYVTDQNAAAAAKGVAPAGGGAVVCYVSNTGAGWVGI